MEIFYQKNKFDIKTLEIFPFVLLFYIKKMKIKENLMIITKFRHCVFHAPKNMNKKSTIIIDLKHINHVPSELVNRARLTRIFPRQWSLAVTQGRKINFWQLSVCWVFVYDCGRIRAGGTIACSSQHMLGANWNKVGMNYSSCFIVFIKMSL